MPHGKIPTIQNENVKAIEEDKLVSLNNRINELISDVGDEISRLENKLSLVLVPEKPSGEEGNGQDKIQESEAVEMQLRVVGRLENTIGALRTLRNRIDL